jgi:L-histidine Nalpha-methyltransferase
MSSMSESFEKVYVHPSQFPNQVYQDYLACFALGKINHKFHYDSVKQSQKWLKIHEYFSPARTSDDCINAYAKCFEKTAKIVDNFSNLQLIGLGCGGGEKDKLLISYLFNTDKKIIYYPVDVSLSLSLISAQKIRGSYPQVAVQPIVCDLLHSDDLIDHLHQGEGERKIITFFGMIPNFYPDEILPILSNFLQEGDILLMSANLSPGDDYLEGINKVMSQYDNELTQDWLMTVLVDAGINPESGTMKFTIKDDPKNPDLKRINAGFKVENDVSLKLDDQVIQWQTGDEVQLFFSYRYTTRKIQEFLQKYDIKVMDYWEGANQEEGIYFCQKV